MNYEITKVEDSSTDSEPERGDIVQITDEHHHWFPCLIVIDEIKSFGIQGYMTVPDNDRQKVNGNAYIRLNKDQYEKVGSAVIVSA